MNKIIFIFTLLCCTFATRAQNNVPRYDTVMVAVYNTGAKYRIAPADFGVNVNTLFNKDKQFIGTLVAGNDTIHTWAVKNCDTCKFKKQQKTLTVSHGCNNVNGDIKGKVVILDLGSCKDATKMTLSAQKQGAKAVIFTHYEDDRDKISIKHNNDSEDKSSLIQIPVFSVRKTTGDKMSAMLPSHIGIKEPNILLQDQNLLTVNDTLKNTKNAATAVAAKSTGTTETEAVKDSINRNNSIANQIAGGDAMNRVSTTPNPADDVIYLHYKFDVPQSVRINITNSAGAVIFSGKINAADTEGEYEIDTKNWATGIYFVTTISAGNISATEKIVVQR